MGKRILLYNRNKARYSHMKHSSGICNGLKLIMKALNTPENFLEIFQLPVCHYKGVYQEVPKITGFKSDL